MNTPLVDRGANGGLAGSDMGILFKSTRKCNVKNIHYDDMPDLDIVQCAALVQTQHGVVNLIMNDYAYYGQGPTIHSSGQIEWYNNFVDDKVHPGRWDTSDLVSRDRLIYLEFISKPTIDYLTKYPSVHLTSPHAWDLTMLDHTLLQMEGSMDHQWDLQKVHNRKYYQQESLMACSDPDVIKIHLQSSLCLNLTCLINLVTKSSHHQKRMGSRLMKKETKS